MLTSPILTASEIKAEFKTSFYNNYTSGKCGPNILNFIQKVENLGIDIKRGKVLKISNKGYHTFVMVNAEKARTKNGGPSEKNWYHHVIFELDGFIYDFDYFNLPTVDQVSVYFNKMFLIEDKKTKGSSLYVGKENKLRDYQVEIISIDAALNRAKYKSKILKLSDFLNLF